MIILLHLLNDNRDCTTGFYWSSEYDVLFPVIYKWGLTSLNIHHHEKKTPMLFEELCSYNTLIRNYYALLFLLVPGQASQENLLVRQVLSTSRITTHVK
jgi:hypothetical protein